jgi:hypothetical protein
MNDRAGIDPGMPDHSRPVKLATAGVVLVGLAFLVVGLVLVDKKHFGGLVGGSFLMAVSATVILGSLLVFIAGWKLRGAGWKRAILVTWGVIGIISPALGPFLILMPWAVLLVLLPAVIVALATASR